MRLTSAATVFQLFLEEERERELEQMYESGVADSLNRTDRPIGAAADGSEIGDVGDEVEDVQKATSETLMAGERIMDAIELADADRQLTQDYEESRAKATGEMKDALLPPQRSALIVASGNPTPDRYVLGVIEKVPTANMEDALLVLPFKQVISLLEYLDIWAKTVRRLLVVFTQPPRWLTIFVTTGREHHIDLPNPVLPTENSPPSDRQQPRHADHSRLAS
jgi:U3 small nucleolar RNA-associated protein 12